ncbi:MAG: ATP-binding cassette domain-containing protein [Candidatus Doudnabacteria bacterium]
MSPIIEAKGLTRMFGKLTAVNNISFSVEPGEIFGLLGPNGAGKSTTLSMLCTILRPTAGTAVINSYNVVERPARVRKSIGIVFQDPSLDDRLTGLENLQMHGNLYGVPRGSMKGRIDDVLELVELSDRANDQVRTYSSGMRRRLEIARALIHYPKVLFLDEPTIGLDPQSRDHIWTYITGLKKQEGITIILTSHYLDEADKLCDRISIVDHGNIVAMDTPHNLKKQLEGETILLRSNNNAMLAAKVEVAGLADKISAKDGELKINVKDARKTMPRIIEIAVANQVFIESFELREPNLDDVFLHYTGRGLRQSAKESPIAAYGRRSR